MGKSDTKANIATVFPYMKAHIACVTLMVVNMDESSPKKMSFSFGM